MECEKNRLLEVALSLFFFSGRMHLLLTLKDYTRKYTQSGEISVTHEFCLRWFFFRKWLNCDTEELYFPCLKECGYTMNKE